MLLSINKNKFFKKLAAITGLFIFVAFLSINFFSIHSHVLEAGTHIIHSHLVNETQPDSDKSSHSHTESEYKYYFLIYIFSKSFQLFTLY